MSVARASEIAVEYRTNHMAVTPLLLALMDRAPNWVRRPGGIEASDPHVPENALSQDSVEQRASVSPTRRRQRSQVSAIGARPLQFLALDWTVRNAILGNGATVFAVILVRGHPSTYAGPAPASTPFDPVPWRMLLSNIHTPTALRAA
jgi:hypothetical protein